MIFADQRCMPIFMVLLPGVTASAVYSSYRGGLWGQKNFFAFSLCEFIEQLLIITTGMILVSRVSGVIAGVKNAAISVSISYIASALISVCIYFYYDGKIRNPRGYYKTVLNSAAPLTGIRVASSIFTSILAIIVPIRLKLSGLTSSQALSEFGIASGMTLPLLFIPATLVSALALVLIPELSEKKNKKTKNVSLQIENSLLFSIIVSFGILAIFLGAGKDIGIALYDNSRSGELLLYSCALMIPMSLSHMSSSILNTLGREYKSLKNYLWGAGVMLISVWFLPPILGIYSMILGFFLSFTITAFLNTYIIIKNIKNTGLFFKSLPKILPAFLISFLLCFFINNILKRFIPLLISIGIASIVSMTAFVLVCVLFKLCNFDIFFKNTLKRLTKNKKSCIMKGN